MVLGNLVNRKDKLLPVHLDDFFGALDDGQSFSQAASSLNVPAEFLDFKARLMKEKGYELGDSPITANSKFLKSMTVPDYYEYGC